MATTRTSTKKKKTASGKTTRSVKTRRSYGSAGRGGRRNTTANSTPVSKNSNIKTASPSPPPEKIASPKADKNFIRHKNKVCFAEPPSLIPQEEEEKVEKKSKKADTTSETVAITWTEKQSLDDWLQNLLMGFNEEEEDWRDCTVQDW